MAQSIVRQTRLKTKTKYLYPLLASQERLLAWKKAKGMWRNKPNMIAELKKIRKGWTRKPISLR